MGFGHTQAYIFTNAFACWSFSSQRVLKCCEKEKKPTDSFAELMRS